jgi:hypothetical protein
MVHVFNQCCTYCLRHSQWVDVHRKIKVDMAGIDVASVIKFFQHGCLLRARTAPGAFSEKILTQQRAKRKALNRRRNHFAKNLQWGVLIVSIG